MGVFDRLRRGHGDGDLDQVQPSDKRMEPSGESRGAEQVATRPASTPVSPVKKSGWWKWVLGLIGVLVFCFCALIFLLPSQKELNDRRVKVNPTITAIIQGTLQSTPVSGAAVSTPVVSAEARPTPQPTPTVVAAVYVPPWQREYDNTLETLGTLLCLAIPVVICILLTAWLWRQTQPLPAREVTTIFSYSQGNIIVKWSISAKLFARVLPLLRERLLKKDALSQVIEYLQTAIQTFGVSLEPSRNIRDDIILFFGEFNLALKARREGSVYRFEGRIANNPKARRTGTFIRSKLVELREREERFGIEVIEFFVAEDFAEMSSTLQAYLAEVERQAEEDREAEEERTRELVQEQRHIEQGRKEAEEAEMRMNVEAKEFAAQLSILVFNAGYKQGTPEADFLIKTFTAKKEAEIRARTEETLARLRLDLDREIAQRAAAVREREVEADAQRARALAQFAETVNRLASVLDGFDLTEAVRIFASARQAPPAMVGETSLKSREDGRGGNERNQKRG